MRNGCRRAVVVLGLLCLAPAGARAQPGAIRATAQADRTQIALAQSVRVALTIEGPAPLRVELPEALLTADANAAWRIRPDPPTSRAEVTPAGAGRERWQQVFRLDPYAEGAPLVASFNPVTVNGQAVAWEPVAVAVTRTVGDPATTPPRPPVGPEDPPPPPPAPADEPVPAWWAAALVVSCAAVAVAARRRARKAKPAPPAEWAAAELAKLEGNGGAETVERVAAVLRAFVERRFAIPAPKLTTAELAAAAGEQGWPVEQAEPLRALLDECDRGKFARDVPDGDGCRRLVGRAVDWVNHVGRPAGPG
jgi:hypothetical protein